MVTDLSSGSLRPSRGGADRRRSRPPGEVVLLSTACASYDMFTNYVHRAQVFAEAVASLPQRL